MAVFSAGPQALGYLYQVRAALFTLLQYPDEASIKIEAMDDIEVVNPEGEYRLELTQLKHHITKEAELTDHSPDLWKSIRVWAEQVADRSFVLKDTKLFLVTTSQAPEKSIASMLGLKNRDCNTAKTKLLDIANSSENKKLTSSFKAFIKLSEVQKDALLNSIIIFDQNPNIEEYQLKITQLIRPAVHKQYVKGLYERLEGWWFNKVVLHLLNPNQYPQISAFELHEKNASIAESFHNENLPIDYLHEDHSSDFLQESKNKLFVHQLEAIKARPLVIKKATLDYYRSFQQRSRWLQEGLIFPQELEHYESILIDEWERYFDLICGDSGENLSEEELITQGNKILKWIEFDALHLKIRPKVDADYVRRGTFHMLADKEPVPLVYWHPKFKEKLTAVMASAVPEK